MPISSDCHTLSGDQIPDLVMRFSTHTIYDALQLGDLEPGDAIEVTLTGTLVDGCEFTASDCLFIRE
ncbi:MAG: hypothetical protein IID38_06210 [Planctomycetes bacterium]|nr:hypothetical protein [Planctomycetota bacterium]